MITDFGDLWEVIYTTLIIFGLLLLVFRKHIMHLFDPLLYFIVTQAFSIKLAFISIKSTGLLFDFLACELCFLTGIFFTIGRPLNKLEKQTGIFFKSAKATHISLLKWYAFFATIILTIGNIILIKQKGIALLSDDPTGAKVTDFTDGTGLGIVRRFNSSLLYITSVILIYLFIYKKQVRYALMVLLLMMFAAFSGSKSSLLFFVFLTSFFFYFKDLDKDVIVKSLKSGSYLILGLSFFLVAVILTNSGSAGSINDAILKLGTRFLFYGDAIMYYYNPSSIHFFSGNNIFTFLSDEFNYVLGFLRLVPYNTPINFQLIDYYVNLPTNDTFGPNVPFYIKGNIYFGTFGGLIYSFIIGCCVGYARKLFYNLVRNHSASIIISILIIFLNLIIYSLPQDSPLFISKISDTFFLSIPVLLLVFIIHLPLQNFNSKRILEL